MDCLDVLGARDARGRVPLRRGVGADPRRGRRADGAPAGGLAASSWPTCCSTPRSSPRRGTPPASTRSGYFPGYRWAEWNGRYRDTVRRFVRGDAGLVGDVAAPHHRQRRTSTRRSGHAPINSVNFITCHDGFTLNDLVSYDGKHNEANGEDNRDGNDDNMSWNCGGRGPDRRRRASRPCALAPDEELRRPAPAVAGRADARAMGDEVRRTQQGNNNAYCQDNEISLVRLGPGRIATADAAAVLAAHDRVPPGAPDAAPAAVTSPVPGTARGLPT